MNQHRHRAIALTVLLAGVVPLTGACGARGNTPAGDSGTGAGSPHAGAVAYAACMRHHGVPKYPDPDSRGMLPKGTGPDFGVSDAAFQTARHACQSMMPANSGTLNPQNFRQCVQTGDCPAALVQAAMSQMRTFADCMRHHGVPKFPDPTIGQGGAPAFPASRAGLSHSFTHSSQFDTVAQACQQQVGNTPLLMD